MARKKQPKPPQWVDGTYRVAPPVWGCINAWVGEFKDNDEPREVLLSASQAAELGGPDHPFTLDLVVEPPPEE